MIQTRQSLADCLAGLLPRLPPAVMLDVAPFQAIGSVLATELVAPADLPAGPVALAAGFAVVAADTLGAAPDAPLPLSRLPERVVTGDPLPRPCDAVLAPELVNIDGLTAEVTGAVAPGEDVRLPGHDLAAGTVIGRSGAVVTADMALAAAACGLRAIPVSMVTVAVAPASDPTRDWLCARLSALGCRSVADPTAADLVVDWSDHGAPQLALAPGAAIAIAGAARGGAPVFRCPPGLAAIGALYAALLLPCIATMTQRRLRCVPLPLARKVASRVGVAELVLLRREQESLIPLAIGDCPLGAMGASDGFAIIPADSEGLGAGVALAYCAWAQPFESVEVS